MKSRVEKELAAAALAGEANAEPLLLKALLAFRRTRFELDTLVSQVLSDRSKRTTYTRIGLPYGAHCDLDLLCRTAGTPDKASTQRPILKVYTKTGHMAATQDPKFAAGMLASRLRGKVEATVKVLLGIERARKRLFELAEEATRWQ